MPAWIQQRLQVTISGQPRHGLGTRPGAGLGETQLEESLEAAGRCGPAEGGELTITVTGRGGSESESQ